MGRVASVILGNVVRGAFTALRKIERKEFLENNSNAVAAMLGRIFQHEDAPATDRFLVLILEEGHYEHAYVQCLFRGEMALIELSSGYFAQKPGQPRARKQVGPHKLKRLAALGFTTDDSEGNFQCFRDLRDTPPQDLAELMLTALFDTYCSKASDQLCWESPFVRGYDYEVFLAEGEAGERE